MIFNRCQCRVDLQPDFGIMAIFIKVPKRRCIVQLKALPAHGTLDTAFITVVLLPVLLSLFLRNVAQIFYEQHGKNVVLITGTVNFTAKAVAGVPKNAFDFRFCRHSRYPFLCA